MSQPPVIVIGGGIAGLTAAAHLAARGVPPILLEANQTWLGGRLSSGEPDTFTHGGQTWRFPAEHGIHGLWGGYVNLRATIARFVPPEMHPQPSNGEMWVNRWGEKVWKLEAGSLVRHGWLPAPFHYLNLLFHPRFYGAITPLDYLSLPGILFSLLSSVGYDPLREQSALDGWHMRDFFRLWTPNLSATLKGVARNMLAAPDEAITYSGLIAALRFYTLLRRDTWHPHFFPANIQPSLIAPLTDAITQHDGQIVYGATATELERTPNGWTVHFTDAQGQTLTVGAPQVILALHGSAAQKLLLASPVTQPQAATLRFPSGLRNAVVRLWFSAAPKDSASSGMFTGDFVPDNYFWLHRIHREYDAWRATGGSAIELHFYGDAALLNQPDRHFLIMAGNEVIRAFPELKGTLVHGAVRRNSATHTAFRVMTADVLPVVTAWDGVFACGDWIRAETPALWMERAATTALVAVNATLNERGLPPYPIEQPPPPELTARILGGAVRAVRALFSPLIRWGRYQRTRRRNNA